MKIQVLEDVHETRAVIKAIGVGGAGGNAINRMAEAGVKAVELIAANSDAQDLRRSLAHIRVQIGEKLTKGLGVGGDSARGRAAMEESAEQIREILKGSDMVFITAGMGGGTGTGGAPLVSQIARELGALTVGVVTRPFAFEKLNRANIAEQGIQEMRKNVDTLLVIPNQRLLDVSDSETTAESAFHLADDVLRKAVQSISDVITMPGNINMDLNDMRAIMKDAGEALIGMGEASGMGRAAAAAKAAIHSPLLENVVMDGAKGLIVNITGRKDGLKLAEMEEVMDLITGAASPDAKIKMGKAYDDSLGDSIRITVIATGFPVRRNPRHFFKTNHFPDAPNETILAGRKKGDVEAAKPQDLDDLSKPAFLRLKTRRLK
jgi:cell division protein FtsZ